MKTKVKSMWAVVLLRHMPEAGPASADDLKANWAIVRSETAYLLLATDSLVLVYDNFPLLDGAEAFKKLVLDQL